jgi:ubiquinone/menaquinone biosynthesis C-methylase UbiE
MNNYDDIIKSHYNNVAEKYGDSSSSTMLDDEIRSIETKSIDIIISDIINNNKKPINIADVGCGNGFTISELFNLYPQNNFLGIENNQKLMEIASNRFNDFDNVKVTKGDIRTKGIFNNFNPDVLICQRVLINLLNKEDQKEALQNTINSLKKGATLIFIEAFTSGLENLNILREEFGLEPILMSHHNLYLDDEFFNVENLNENFSNLVPTNFLSSHYFISRGLYPGIIGNGNFKRNSEFAKFFSQAVKSNIGNYAPLRFSCFNKI